MNNNKSKNNKVKTVGKSRKANKKSGQKRSKLLNRLTSMFS